MPRLEQLLEQPIRINSHQYLPARDRAWLQKPFNSPPLCLVFEKIRHWNLRIIECLPVLRELFQPVIMPVSRNAGCLTCQIDPTANAKCLDHARARGWSVADATHGKHSHANAPWLTTRCLPVYAEAPRRPAQILLLLRCSKPSNINCQVASRHNGRIVPDTLKICCCCSNRDSKLTSVPYSSRALQGHRFTRAAPLI